MPLHACYLFISLFTFDKDITVAGGVGYGINKFLGGISLEHTDCKSPQECVLPST